MKLPLHSSPKLRFLALLCALSISVAMQADLFLEARSLRSAAAGLQSQRAAWGAFESSLRAELAVPPAVDPGPDSASEIAAHPALPGGAVDQLARLLAALSQSDRRDVAWNSVRFSAEGARAAPPSARPNSMGASRDVAGLFAPLVRSPGLLGARVTAQGEYRSIEGLAAEVAHLRDLAVVVGDLDLEGHRVSLGLTLLARAQ
jgi:hypothetical protein